MLGTIRSNRIKRRILMSYVYIMKSNNVYKIGVTNSVKDRIKSLQTGNSCVIEDVYNVWIGAAAYSVENKLHKMYSHCRLEGEWFSLTSNEISTIITLLQHEACEIPEKSCTDVSLFMFDLGSSLNQSEKALVRFIIDSYHLKELSNNIEIKPAKCSLYNKYLTKALEKSYKHLYRLHVLVRLSRGKYVVNLLLLGVTSAKITAYFNSVLSTCK